MGSAGAAIASLSNGGTATVPRCVVAKISITPIRDVRMPIELSTTGVAFMYECDRALCVGSSERVHRRARGAGLCLSTMVAAR
jgi:hypothetical protein